MVEPPWECSRNDFRHSDGGKEYGQRGIESILTKNRWSLQASAKLNNNQGKNWDQQKKDTKQKSCSEK